MSPNVANDENLKHTDTGGSTAVRIGSGKSHSPLAYLFSSNEGAKATARLQWSYGRLDPPMFTDQREASVFVKNV
jgi:hypothetical protein